MTDEQAERLIVALERIAAALEARSLPEDDEPLPTSLMTKEELRPVILAQMKQERLADDVRQELELELAPGAPLDPIWQKAVDEKWGSQLADHPQYSPLRNNDDLAEALFGISHDDPLTTRVAWHVTGEARHLYEQVVKPRRIKEALDDLPKLRAEVAQEPDWPVARTVKAKRVVARRVLQARFGFGTDALEDAVVLVKD